MDAINRLEELAKDAEHMPWEHSPADVPYSARQAFRDGCDPSTILRLVRVARLADKLLNRPEMASGYHQRMQRQSDEDNLRAALTDMENGNG
jgi:hypothetical protein